MFSQQEEQLMTCFSPKKLEWRKIRDYWSSYDYSEIHFWLYRVWSLVTCSQKKPFRGQEHQKNKNYWNTLFGQKDEPVAWQASVLQCFISISQKTKQERFTLYVDNKDQVVIGYVFVQNVKTRSVFTFQPITTSSLHDCKKGKANCYVLDIPFKEKSRHWSFSGSDGTFRFAKRKLATTKSHLIFQRTFSVTRKLPQPNFSRKNPNWFHNWQKTCWAPIDWINGIQFEFLIQLIQL